MPDEVKSDPDFNPDDVCIALFGCCSYEATWKPGIEGWGENDEESRSGGYVSVCDWDELLRRYKALLNRLNSGNPNYTPYQVNDAKRV